MAHCLHKQSTNFLCVVSLSPRRRHISLRSVGDGLACHPAAGASTQAEHASDNDTRHRLKPIALGSERKLSGTVPASVDRASVVRSDNGREYESGNGLVSTTYSSFQFASASARGRCRQFQLRTVCCHVSTRTLIPRSQVRILPGPFPAHGLHGNRMVTAGQARRRCQKCAPRAYPGAYLENWTALSPAQATGCELLRRRDGPGTVTSRWIAGGVMATSCTD